MNKDYHTPEGIYLLSHSVGCLPHSARRALEEKYFEPWGKLGGNVWPTWLEQIEEFKTALAMLLGSSADAFCPQTNISSALTKIFGSLSNDGAKYILAHSQQDFPSTGFVIAQTKKMGYQTDVLSDSKKITELDEWDAILTPQTKAVFITHVSSDVSAMAPVKEIIEIAQRRNIVTIIDVAQSAGVIPISLEEWGADFVIGSSVKWLCGGPGAAFLWINPNGISQWEPVDVGWFSHQSPFDFDINHFEYADSASRFWGGTPSISPFITATVGINELLRFGIEKSYKHNRRLTQKIIDFADEENFIIKTPLSPQYRGGTISIRFQEPERIRDRLNVNNVYFDIRKEDVFRFSPHIYNEDKDIDELFNILQSC